MEGAFFNVVIANRTIANKKDNQRSSMRHIGSGVHSTELYGDQQLIPNFANAEERTRSVTEK
jgi:hypothetical protein